MHVRRGALRSWLDCKEPSKRSYNLCPGYRVERLRDYAHAPRLAARVESRNLSKRYLGHTLHAKRSGCGYHF